MPATFFVVDENGVCNAGLLRRIADDGDGKRPGTDFIVNTTVDQIEHPVVYQFEF